LVINWFYFKVRELQDSNKLITITINTTTLKCPLTGTTAVPPHPHSSTVKVVFYPSAGKISDKKRGASK